MISCPSVEKRAIRWHYDLATPFYRCFGVATSITGCGRARNPGEAQLKLTETVIREAGLQHGTKTSRRRVVDVGCGMGVRRSTWRRPGTVTSRASRSAPFNAAGHRGVPLEWGRPANTSWSRMRRPSSSARLLRPCLESRMHRTPVRQARLFPPAPRTGCARWLRGHLRLASRGRHPFSDEARQEVYDVCEGFFCPSLGSADDTAAGSPTRALGRTSFDWTDRVWPNREDLSATARRARSTSIGWPGWSTESADVPRPLSNHPPPTRAAR